MKEVMRYLGREDSGEHTVLVTVRRSLWSPVVLLGLEQALTCALYKGRLGEGEPPFRNVGNGEAAPARRQEKILEFLAECIDKKPEAR